MNTNTAQIDCMASYMVFVIGIGIAFARRANRSSADYF